jgi:hypothetical protein
MGESLGEGDPRPLPQAEPQERSAENLIPDRGVLGHITPTMTRISSDIRNCTGGDTENCTTRMGRWGRTAGGRGAPGVAQRPTDVRCTELEAAPVV